MPCSEPLFKVRPYLNATTDTLDQINSALFKYSRTSRYA